MNAAVMIALALLCLLDGQIIGY